MHDQLLQNIRLFHGNISSLKDVEFWTTVEVRTRCLRIAPRISGTRERECAKALLFSPGPATTTYEDRYLPLPSVRMFPQTASPSNEIPYPFDPSGSCLRNWSGKSTSECRPLTTPRSALADRSVALKRRRACLPCWKKGVNSSRVERRSQAQFLGRRGEKVSTV